MVISWMVRMVRMVTVALLLAGAHASNEASSRLVVTFERASDNVLDGVNLNDLKGVKVVKQYGRRLVLDLGVPFDLEVERGHFGGMFKAVQSVEMDFLVGLQLDESQFLVSDALLVTNATDPDVSGAYINPATQTPLWNLMDSEPYSIHAEGVWQVTNSTPDVVVAVIDTGMATPARYMFLNLLDGYDFISDDGISIDGDGRDPDSTDPGDWGDMCLTPSWHGTKVASILAARHDNEFGMKGVAQNCSLLPVRVLGLCRMGYATDVTDAIVWSAGGTINGVPNNPNPAKIISLSLAGQGACPGYLQSAINQATALGAIVIAAAGNNNQNVSGYFPANCEGVIAVAASTREGTLAGYSNWGALIDVSAPGGDSLNAIMTLGVNELETGLEVAFGMGTSFATPHLAGAKAIYESVMSANYYHTSNQQLFLSFKVNINCAMNYCGRGILSMGKMKQEKKNNTFIESLAHWNISDGLTTGQAGICCKLDPRPGMGSMPIPIGKECNWNAFSTYEGSDGWTYIICWSAWDCPAGKYQDVADQPFCKSCPAGSVSRSTLGSTTFEGACTVCPVNTYSSLPSTVCTSCVAGTYSNPGSSVCKSAITCPAGYTRNPTYDVVSSSYTANCPLGSYVCGFNYQNLFGYYFYCCALGGVQVGHWRISTGNFNGGVGAGVLYTSTGTGYPPSPFSAPNTNNIFQYGISRFTWNWNGASIYSNLALLFVLGGTGGDSYDSSCQAGKVATGFYGWYGANLDQASVMCNTLCVACSTCGAGSYKQTSCTTSSDTVCQPCSAGTYSISSGVAACTPCGAGLYYGSTGASSSSLCSQCVPGTSSSVLAASSCPQCAAGSYASAYGATSCTLCAAGKFSAAVGAVAASCGACSAGTYSAVAGATSIAICTDCAAGKTSFNGASSCDACVPGSYSISTIFCDSCAPGKYSTAVGASSSATCINCPVGNYTGSAMSTSCPACVPPNYCAAGSTAQPPCPAGFYCPNASTKITCPQNSYCPLGQIAPTLCPAGTRGAAAGGTSLSNCIGCFAGTYSPTGATVCTGCTSGTYASTSNATACTTCSANPPCTSPLFIKSCTSSSDAACGDCSSQTKPAYSTWMDNIVDSCAWVCNRNIPYYFKFNSSTCQACKIPSSCTTGSYVTTCTATVDGVCTPCTNKPPNSNFTSFSSAYDQNACDWSCNAGYSKGASMATCDVCGTGTYSLQGDDLCTICPAGKYTPSTGYSVCSLCQPGTFAPTPTGPAISMVGAASCTNCTAGTYSSIQSATACLSCNSTSYTPTIGATACTLCPLCTVKGNYRSGCSGTSSGTCDKCTNTN